MSIPAFEPTCFWFSSYSELYAETKLLIAPESWLPLEARVRFTVALLSGCSRSWNVRPETRSLTVFDLRLIAMPSNWNTAFEPNLTFDNSSVFACVESPGSSIREKSVTAPVLFAVMLR